MGSVIGPVILGIIIAILGTNNMKGNLSSLHWYHRQRVTEDDRKPFGRLVGLGSLVIGLSLVVFGLLTFAGERLQSDLCVLIGTVILVVAIVAGLALSLYAMIKYNKGIF